MLTLATHFALLTCKKDVHSQGVDDFMSKREDLGLFLSQRPYIQPENNLSNFSKVGKWVLDKDLSLIPFGISEQKNPEFKHLWSVWIWSSSTSPCWPLWICLSSYFLTKWFNGRKTSSNRTWKCFMLSLTNSKWAWSDIGNPVKPVPPYCRLTEGSWWKDWWWQSQW